jgi:hypothetical protein
MVVFKDHDRGIGHGIHILATNRVILPDPDHELSLIIILIYCCNKWACYSAISKICFPS